MEMGKGRRRVEMQRVAQMSKGVKILAVVERGVLILWVMEVEGMVVVVVVKVVVVVGWTKR